MRLLISVDKNMLYALKGAPLYPGDKLVVSAGGRHPQLLAETVAEARRLFPTFPVYSSCSPKRLPEVSKLNVEAVLLDWEPSTVAAWDWDFGMHRSGIGKAAQELPKPMGLLVSAVPLNRKRRMNWNYRELAMLCRGPVVAQTQGMLKRSTLQRLRDNIRGNSPFEEAAMQLKGIPNVGFQVSFKDESAVSPQLAVKACQVGDEYGLTYCYVFGMVEDKTLRFMELLRG